MTENKHASEETVEETAARIEADTATDSDTEKQGNHVAVESTDEVDQADVVEDTQVSEPAKPKRHITWSRVIAYAVLPGLAFVLALGAAFLKFQDSAVRDSNIARDESVQAAKDSTIALLSYKPDTVEQQLTDARDRLTGEFRDQYTSLTKNVVIPGAKEKQISAVANVPEAASVSANPVCALRWFRFTCHAVVLVFVNQTVVVGTGAPTDTASSVRITLDKIGDRWLISEFEPV